MRLFLFWLPIRTSCRTYVILIYVMCRSGEFRLTNKFSLHNHKCTKCQTHKVGIEHQHLHYVHSCVMWYGCRQWVCFQIHYSQHRPWVLTQTLGQRQHSRQLKHLQIEGKYTWVNMFIVFRGIRGLENMGGRPDKICMHEVCAANILGS